MKAEQLAISKWQSKNLLTPEARAADKAGEAQGPSQPCDDSQDGYPGRFAQHESKDTPGFIQPIG